jgi:hypothetical protein
MKSHKLSEVSKEIRNGGDIRRIVPRDWKKIECGSERCVFKYDNAKVIKFSTLPNENTNQNVREFDFYNNIKHSDISHKFAKVINGDPNVYLIQEYIKNVGDVLPQEVEKWVSDVEEFGVSVHDKDPENFGYRGSQVVMVDYAGCYLKD